MTPRVSKCVVFGRDIRWLSTLWAAFWMSVFFNGTLRHMRASIVLRKYLKIGIYVALAAFAIVLSSFFGSRSTKGALGSGVAHADVVQSGGGYGGSIYYGGRNSGVGNSGGQQNAGSSSASSAGASSGGGGSSTGSGY